jgi:tetratricopeptide (TPR) repeat protein
MRFQSKNPRLAILVVMLGIVAAAIVWGGYRYLTAPEKLVAAQLDRIAREDFAAIEAVLSEARAQIGPGGAGDMRLMRLLSAFASTDPELEGRLQRWLAWKPDSAFAHMALGLRLRHVGRAYRGARVARLTRPEAFDRFHETASMAAAHFRSAAALDPDNPLPLIFLADLPGGAGAGEASFIELIAGPTRLSETAFALGLYKAHPKWGGSMAEVAWLMAMLEERIPENPALAKLRGFDDFINADRLISARRYEEALTLSELAMSKGENFWFPHTKARALNQMKRYEEVVAVADAWLVDWPESTTLREDRAKALSRMGRSEEAIAEIDRVLRYDPLDPGLLNVKALKLTELKRLDEALDTVRKARIFGLYDDQVHMREAQVLHARGEYEAARDAALESVRLNPRQPLNHQWLMSIYWAMNACAEVMATGQVYVQVCEDTGDCKDQTLGQVKAFLAELPGSPQCREALSAESSEGSSS